MSEKSELREVYDHVAAELGPRMSDLTASDRFASAVEVVDALRNRAASELQRSSRRFLHACNLPAGTDIAVLRDEIGALERTVRTLARQVEDLQGRLDESATSSERRRAG
jgi:HAMP domain-containing protein